jgi:uncharacterized protein (TIGR02453 family)
MNLTFLRELAANNNRTWFEENKKRYEAEAKLPFERLIESALAVLAEEDAAFEKTTAKDCIYRIYRDVRFSADKTPYKDHVSAVLSANGRKQADTQGLYLEVSYGRLFMAGGSYQPTPAQVAAVRKAIVADMPRFEAILNDAEFRFCFDAMRGEENKRLAPEFVEAAKTQPLLLKKQFLYIAELPATTILQPDIVPILLRYYRATLAMSRFLDEAMGAV